MKRYTAVMFCFWICGALMANCHNVHCCFEYLGCRGVRDFTKDDFMKTSAASANADRYFEKEHAPFKDLDWNLFLLEESVQRKDCMAASNAVSNISHILRCYAVFLTDPETGGKRVFPMRLRMSMLEKIEYSLARMIFGERRNEVAAYFDALLPDSIIGESRNIPSWHSISTFKKMLAIAVAIENYNEKEECYPLNLDSLKLLEEDRKCACGRDIEYEYYRGTWVLRSRCESWEGGLRFDEYIPMIYQQRKHLDLCFSRTFNEKRVSLFNGELLGGEDERLAGRVLHNGMGNGVHLIKFVNPHAGSGRIVPLSEVNARIEGTARMVEHCDDNETIVCGGDVPLRSKILQTAKQHHLSSYVRE